jgi:hypothetical protein
MLKYALIAVTMNGAHAETHVVMRGYETLAECETGAAGRQEVYDKDPDIRVLRWRANPEMPPSKFVCVPDQGTKDDALFDDVK